MPVTYCDAGNITLSQDAVWNYWTSSSSTDYAASARDNVWLCWSSDAQTATHSASVTTLNIVWTNWVENAYVYTTPKETEQERKERLEREAEARRKKEEERARKAAELAAATKKAEQLFIDIFGQVEFDRLQEIGHIEFKGASGKRYRLRPGKMIEVLKLATTKKDQKSEEHDVDHKLCVHHPRSERMPYMDTLICQRLMLADEESEKELVGVANRHSPHSRAGDNWLN